MKKLVLGIDGGGTKTDLALANLDGEIISHPDSDLIGTKLQEFSFGKDIVDRQNGKTVYNFDIF